MECVIGNFGMLNRLKSIFLVICLLYVHTMSEAWAQAPTDGLVAYYALDGNAQDQTSYANHGTVFGATSVVDRHGNPSSAYSFDGNDYISFPSTGQNTFTGPFTISVWVKVDTFQTGQAIEQHPIIDKLYSNGWTGGYRLMANAASNNLGQSINYFALSSNIGGQNAWGESAYTAAQVGMWHHVVGMYDGNGLLIYQDGVQVDQQTETRTGSVSTSSLSLMLGRNSGGGNYWFQGDIDDVRLYDRALSASEISALYQAEAAQSNFRKMANGVTIDCSDAAVGDTGVVDGVEYLAVDNNTLRTEYANGRDMATVCTSHVNNMDQVFLNQFAFNDDISSWDFSNVVIATRMFQSASSFNRDLSTWDTSSMVEAGLMFYDASSFNSDVSEWDTSSLRDATAMFAYALSFSSEMNAWDMSRVVNISAMFQGAQSFNSDISDWDVSSVVDANTLFRDNSLFNQDISQWDVSSITDMRYMFLNAGQFSGDLSSWCVEKIGIRPRNFENYSAMTGAPRWGIGCEAPVASMTASTTNGAASLDVTFDASASFDPDGDDLIYTWDFGDGNTGTGVTTMHTYAQKGAFTAILTVSDTRLATTDSLVITTISGGPTQNWELPLTLSQGDLVRNLGVGVQAGTTDGFDTDIDELAPPPPPSGVLDGRFTGGAEDLLTDVRPPAESISWTLQVQHASSEALTLSWNPTLFPEDVTISLSDAINGSILSVDMATASEAVIPSGLTTLRIIFKTTVTEPVSYTAGWNMIGVPLSGVDQTYEDLFTSEVAGSLFRFATSYSPVSDGILSVGEGYWLRLGLPETVSYEGTPENSVTWDLSTGWNMVSGTTCEVSRSDIEALGGITASTLFGYADTNGYQVADSISPGRAYWIRAKEALQLSVPCASAVGKGREAIASMVKEPQFDFSMSFQSSDGQPPRMIRAGLHAQASDAFDEALDQLAPPVPPAGTLDARFKTASGDMYHDYRSSHDATITWDITFSAPESASLLLSWDREKLSMGGVFRLTDLQGSGAVDLDMTEVGELYVSAGSPLARARGFRIHFIPSASLISDKNAFPEAYDLAAAFPNPFNPTTTIAFELPEMSPVTIQVYDVLGRRVATLLSSDAVAAGRHTVRFAAEDLSSGTYIVWMQAGGFFATQQVVLLK